jgi:hypothetical protein
MSLSVFAVSKKKQEATITTDANKAEGILRQQLKRLEKRQLDHECSFPYRLRR